MSEYKRAFYFADLMRKMTNPEDGIFISLGNPNNAKLVGDALFLAEEMLKEAEFLIEHRIDYLRVHSWNVRPDNEWLARRKKLLNED